MARPAKFAARREFRSPRDHRSAGGGGAAARPNPPTPFALMWSQVATEAKEGALREDAEHRDAACDVFDGLSASVEIEARSLRDD